MSFLSSVVNDLVIARRLLNGKLEGQPFFDYADLDVPNFKADSSEGEGLRLNLVLPTIDKEKIFGGIATAIRYFDLLCDELGCAGRIIVSRDPISSEVRSQWPELAFVEPDSSVVGTAKSKLACTIRSRGGVHASLSVRKHDVFICTFWTTFYRMRKVKEYQESTYGKGMPLLYMIQDYEPGFSPWSAAYMLCESTYADKDTLAVINSTQLADYLHSQGFTFKFETCIHPQLNTSLCGILKNSGKLNKRRQILVYGRPHSLRNCFPLVVLALKDLVERHGELFTDEGWELVSAGASFRPVDLGKGVLLSPVGKLSLEEYGELLKTTSVGFSLMCSPHPSYPPLEMAAFGARVVTNTYGPKNLSNEWDNIISVSGKHPSDFSDAIYSACKSYELEVVPQIDSDYVNGVHGIAHAASETAGVLRRVLDETA